MKKNGRERRAENQVLSVLTRPGKAVRTLTPMLWLLLLLTGGSFKEPKGTTCSMAGSQKSTQRKSTDATNKSALGLFGTEVSCYLHRQYCMPAVLTSNCSR